ncbi:MAG TPA: cyclic nucleotide-binding domain-containing protein [Gemmatimonadaceae bacterium]|nr:cyclic nucleotide-binding domain-containing protein [Gemmatimonadaceae bacterium]
MNGENRPPNLLLLALPADSYACIEPHLERVALARGTVLHKPGEEIRSLYFPIDGLVSVTITMRDERTAETGVVGRREMAGVNAFMGGRETTQTEYVIQVPGGSSARRAGTHASWTARGSRAPRASVIRW